MIPQSIRHALFIPSLVCVYFFVCHGFSPFSCFNVFVFYFVSHAPFWPWSHEDSFSHGDRLSSSVILGLLPQFFWVLLPLNWPISSLLAHANTCVLIESCVCHALVYSWPRVIACWYSWGISHKIRKFLSCAIDHTYVCLTDTICSHHNMPIMVWCAVTS